jgi:hypothetical protein
MKKTKVLKREIKEVKKQEYYTIKNRFGNIEKITIPSNLQVGLDNDEFKSTISGSIHHTRQGKSYLVAGSGVTIVSSSNGQVTISASGGGEEGSDAETVNLTAGSTIIQYDSAGANPSPTSITLTATSKNFTNGFFKFTGGGSDFTDETSYTDGTGANSDTATFTVPSSYSATPYDFRVGVSEGDQSEVVFDTLSIGSTRIGDTGSTGNTGANGNDGSDGSGVSISLDPLSVLLIANSSGTVSDFTPSGATIKVYENGTAINVNTSVSSNSTWYIVSATGTNITAGAVSQTNGQSSATVADASSITADTATIAHVVRVKNSLGTTTDYTVTQTLAKAIGGADGNDGSDGTVALAIFGVDSSSSSTDSDNAVSQTGSSIAQFTTPYHNTAVVANTNVVSSANSGELTLNGNGTYSVTVSMDVQEEGDAKNTYELTLALDDGVGSYTTLSYLSTVEPGGDEKSGNLIISNAIITASSGGVIKLKSQIKKSASNNTFLHVNQSTQRLATIRVEKLS